jgi:hypothetical protein
LRRAKKRAARWGRNLAAQERPEGRRPTATVSTSGFGVDPPGRGVRKNFPAIFKGRAAVTPPPTHLHSKMRNPLLAISGSNA